MASPRPTQQHHSADGFPVAIFHSAHTEHNLVSHFPQEMAFQQHGYR